MKLSNLKPSILAIPAIAALGIGAAGVGVAQADRGHDGEKCNVVESEWQPMSAVLDKLEGEGWSIHEIERDDGCYEVEGVTTDGQKIEAYLDPSSLEIVKMKHKD